MFIDATILKMCILLNLDVHDTFTGAYNMGEPAPTVQKIKKLVDTRDQTEMETLSTEENLGVYLFFSVLLKSHLKKIKMSKINVIVFHFSTHIFILTSALK